MLRKRKILFAQKILNMAVAQLGTEQDAQS
jgi:hypothetical protein